MRCSAECVSVLLPQEFVYPCTFFFVFLMTLIPHIISDLLDFTLQARLDRQSSIRPFCEQWQVWRKRGVCCRVQRRRAWQSMSVVMPLSAQLWHLSSQPLHRSLLAPDHHVVLIPVAALCCAVLCCAMLCCLCYAVDCIRLFHPPNIRHLLT